MSWCDWNDLIRSKANALDIEVLEGYIEMAKSIQNNGLDKITAIVNLEDVKKMCHILSFLG